MAALGSLADLEPQSNSSAALERLAETSPGGRADLADTGRSDRPERPKFDDRKRPEAELSASL